MQIEPLYRVNYSKKYHKYSIIQLNQKDQQELQFRFEQIQKMHHVNVNNRNKMLKGLKLQIQEQISLQTKIGQTQELLKLQKQPNCNYSFSTNISFDNMPSVSQVNSTSGKKQRQLIETIKDRYQKQILEKERELIELKKEKYIVTDILEDTQYELIQQKKIQLMQIKNIKQFENDIQKFKKVIEFTRKKNQYQNNNGLNNSFTQTPTVLTKIKEFWTRRNPEKKVLCEDTYSHHIATISEEINT